MSFDKTKQKKPIKQTKSSGKGFKPIMERINTKINLIKYLK